MNPQKQRSRTALDFVSFFLADVETGAGPFMAGYFAAVRQWNPEQIGLILAAQKIASVLAQGPAGYFIDQTRFKNWLMAAVALVISSGAVFLVWAPTVFWQIINQCAVGVSTATATPLLAALSLGIVGRNGLARRLGRNGAFSHAGNMLTAAVTGYLGYRIGQQWIFYLSACAGVACAVAALLIRGKDIDNEAAREAPEKHDEKGTSAANFRELLRHRAVLMFALVMVLFHAANSAMLPLAGEQLSIHYRDKASLYLLGCIVLPQVVMIPISILSGNTADRWGRKPILLCALSALTLRGVLFSLSHHPYYVMSIEVLDGIGTGIAGVVTALVVADLAKGTGRFNTLGGFMQACLGLGAFLGNLLAGMAVKRAGFPPVFLGLAGVAFMALLLLFFAMPETRQSSRDAGVGAAGSL